MRLRAIRVDLTDATITRHHGRIVKLMGDGAIVVFDSVVDAVACAAEIQNAVTARNVGLPTPERILFRIGINLGDVALVDGDVYGDGVNVAARLEQLAEAGGVMVSGTAFEPMPDAGFEPTTIGRCLPSEQRRPSRARRLTRR